MVRATTATRGVVIADRQNPLLGGKRKQHEGELTRLGERERKQQILILSEPENAPKNNQDDELDEDESGHQSPDETGVLRDLAEVDRGPDGDEKEPQQEALERLDVAFEFVPVLAGRQNHTSQKGAQRRAQADLGHQESDPDHQQQSRRGKDLRHVRLGDETERRPHHESAPDHDGRHRRHHDQRRPPPRQTLDPGRRVPCLRRLLGSPGVCQQGQDRQHGNHSEILKEQDRESAPPAAGLHQALLLQGLQHDGGRRQREDEPDGKGAAPVETSAEGDRGEYPGGHAHLEPAETEDRAPQPPQQGRLQLEPDKKQHHHDAELGEVQDVLAVLAHQPEGERPNGDARHEIAQHRAQTESFGDGHRDHRCREVYQCLIEESFTVHPSASQQCVEIGVDAVQTRRAGRRHVTITQSLEQTAVVGRLSIDPVAGEGVGTVDHEGG